MNKYMTWDLVDTTKISKTADQRQSNQANVMSTLEHPV